MDLFARRAVATGRIARSVPGLATVAASTVLIAACGGGATAAPATATPAATTPAATLASCPDPVAYWPAEGSAALTKPAAIDVRTER